VLGWLVKRRLAKFEREFDYDLTYVREIFAASPCAFFKFSKIFTLAAHRGDAPPDAWFAAIFIQYGFLSGLRAQVRNASSASSRIICVMGILRCVRGAISSW